MSSGTRLDPHAAPDWLKTLITAAAEVDVSELSRHNQPRPDVVPRRHAAVLVLFGETPAAGPDLLFQERAGGLGTHAGQVSFPGGGHEAQDGDLVATALREAAEETGLDPAGVDPLGLLPDLFIPPSGYLVRPVLAYWRQPVEVRVVDTRESAAVVRVPVSELADPANRFVVRHPSGWLGPAFEVAGMIVWGFTAAVTDALLRLGGWERPWSSPAIRDLDRAWQAARTRRRGCGIGGRT
ncbi:MAG: CoA pyrophosphatase [Pseudonocardiales bacterium]|nr:CoA pyrophosphatase [Pseudonocardiales bacterium]